MLRFQVNNLNNMLEDFDKNTFDFTDICKKIDKQQKITKDKFFEITFCDDKLMKELNYKHRNINKSTDVLSFALADNPSNLTNLLGEIYISTPYAKKESKRLKTTFKAEIDLLFTHGVLHLLGFDHDTDKKHKQMFKFQDEILK